MYYVFDVTVPSNTPKNNPKIEILKVARGVIHEVYFLFPTGCFGLAKARLQLGYASIIPTNPDGWVLGDGTLTKFRTWFNLMNESNYLTFLGYNLDDTYDHTITVGVGILPEWVLLPVSATKGVIASLKSVFVGKR